MNRAVLSPSLKATALRALVALLVSVLALTLAACFDRCSQKKKPPLVDNCPPTHGLDGDLRSARYPGGHTLVVYADLPALSKQRFILLVHLNAHYRMGGLHIAAGPEDERTLRETLAATQELSLTAQPLFLLLRQPSICQDQNSEGRVCHTGEGPGTCTDDGRCRVVLPDGTVYYATTVTGDPGGGGNPTGIPPPPTLHGLLQRLSNRAWLSHIAEPGAELSFNASVGDNEISIVARHVTRRLMSEALREQLKTQLRPE